MNLRTHILTIVAFALLVLGCSRDLDVPELTDISKKDREVIGDFISEAILYNSKAYPLVVKDNRTTPAYIFIQAIYDQITYSQRADFDSFSNNRWTKDRPWEVHIFESSDQIAFALPGGTIYISDQLLKSLTSTAELFYILSMESIIMSNDLLFKELVAEYSTKALKEIAETGRSGDPRIEDIEEFVPNINFRLQTDFNLSELTVNHVCRTSRYDPKVEVNIATQLSPNSQWMKTRQLNSVFNLLEVCGGELNKQDYQTFVLDLL